MTLEYRPDDFLMDDSPLRELWVLDADVSDWRKLLKAALDVEWPTHFWSEFGHTLRDVSELDGSALRTVLHDNVTTSPELFFTIGDVWPRCYFFHFDEAIEFTFYTAEVESAVDFASVAAFMTWLGDVCGKRVTMTPEISSPPDGRHAMLEYVPAVADPP